MKHAMIKDIWQFIIKNMRHLHIHAYSPIFLKKVSKGPKS